MWWDDLKSVSNAWKRMKHRDQQMQRMEEQDQLRRRFIAAAGGRKSRINLDEAIRKWPRSKTV